MDHPRARAVREYVLMPEQPGAHMQQAALFGHPSTHALAAVVATIQQHAESLEDKHVVNAVALVSAIAAKADGSSECADCFPEACACAEHGLARLVGQLAALEGAALSISQRGQRGALEKLLCQAISSAATDPPLARATIGALRRAAGEESREGVETLVPRLLCRGVPSELGLLRAGAPLLSAVPAPVESKAGSTVHARLGESDNPEVRVRAVSLLWQLWQQAAARWPALPHGLQLAEALARTANRSALLDPSGKVRLAVVRLLLGLAPQLAGPDLGSEELMQLALLKCSDKAKEVRRLGLVLLATLALPALPEQAQEQQQQQQETQQGEYAGLEQRDGLVGGLGPEQEQAGPEELSARLPRLPPEQVAQMVRDSLEAHKDRHTPLLRRFGAALLWRFVVGEAAGQPAEALRVLRVREQPLLFEPLLSRHVHALYLAQWGEAHDEVQQPQAAA